MKRFRHDISRGNTHISVNITEPKDAKSAELVKYEEGTFIAGTAIKVRNAPSTAAKHTGTLQKDDVIIYDRVYEGGGYRWLSYVSHSGARLYLPYRPIDDTENQWGTFS